jgi:acetyltransferase AlgX (SGNH hydrolase-like protein)
LTASEDAKALRGKNGRLFLDGDTNQVVRQHTGELLLSEQQLEEWQRLLENRVAWLRQMGTEYLFLVPPTAHSVYPEDMPDELPQGETRPVLQVIERLESAQSFARLIYPLEQILAAKPDPLLYRPTGTHWSSSGAFIAYEAVADEIPGNVRMHRVSKGDLVMHDSVIPGDLGLKLDPVEKSSAPRAVVQRPRVELVSDNLIPNTGSMLTTECADAPSSTCLIFGDSFSRLLLPYLAASFRRMVFAHLPTLDYGLVLEVRPDIVMSVLNERFLVEVPHDVGAPTQRGLEREKRGLGRFRDVWIAEWPRASDFDARSD